MKNSDYWKQRFELLEQSQNQQGIQCYAELERQYRLAQRTIEGQIASWYQRFAKNNGLSLTEARKMLNSKELAEFKWGVKEYIRYGEENAINGAWCKQLENASVRYHISRLEALTIQTQQSIEVLFGNQLDSIDGVMRKIYTSGYYKTAFEIQKGVGVGWDFSILDDKRISKVINKPWAADGRNFSERVWGNRRKLVNELNTTLTQNIVLGKDPQKAIDEIARKMKTSKNVTGRLVMTEEAFFSSAAQRDCFNELDVEQYEILATLDSRTSVICQDMDGKVFPMSQYEVSVTAPPFHVYCRSTTVPFFDDEFASIGERATRGEDGKTYYVPADMAYKEWKKQYVQKGLSAGEKETGRIPKHNKPEKLGSIDFSNRNMVLSKLQEYESKIADNTMENAIVISTDGIIRQCYGNLNGVYPDSDLGNELIGGFVTHNHPIGSVNEYSFSKADINLFMDNKLEILRGIDEKYIYELTRNVDEIDEHVEMLEMDQFSMRHAEVIIMAEKLKIGYRRWLRA